MPCRPNADAIKLPGQTRQAELLKKRSSGWMKLLANTVDTIAYQDNVLAQAT